MSKQRLIYSTFILFGVLLGMGLGIGIGSTTRAQEKPNPLQGIVVNTTNKPPKLLEIYTGAAGATMVVSLDWDGNVTYGKGYDANSAAKEFWDAMGKEYKSRCLAENK